jgi:glutaredoxin 3
MAVEMYYSNFCPFCHRARALLDRKGAIYRLIDVDGNAALRTEMRERSGRHTVPQIFIGDRHVGGFDDLAALERASQLDPLLADDSGATAQ